MNMNTIKELWEALNNSCLKKFHYWPNADVPRGRPGVYLIQQDQELIYVGMAKKNLYGRLHQHAGGRRSGDQFCVYVCDRLILPRLTNEEIQQVGKGELLLDKKVRAFVREQLSYKFIETDNEQLAMELERFGIKAVQDQTPDLLNSRI